jgi:hypothetical protein
VVTIADNEPVVSVEATDPFSIESGGDAAAFTLTRSGDLAAAFTARFALRGRARNGIDYVWTPYFAQFAPGESTVVIPIVPIDDLRCDPDENVILRLRYGRGYKPDPDRRVATVYIADDEPYVQLTCPDASAAEQGEDPGLFLLTRTGWLEQDLSVWCALWGTARNGRDYARIERPVVIPAGVSQVEIPVLPNDDRWPERDETVAMAVRYRWCYGRDPDCKRGVVTIEDNDSVQWLRSRSVDVTDAPSAWLAAWQQNVLCMRDAMALLYAQSQHAPGIRQDGYARPELWSLSSVGGSGMAAASRDGVPMEGQKSSATEGTSLAADPLVQGGYNGSSSEGAIDDIDGEANADLAARAAKWPYVFGLSLLPLLALLCVLFRRRWSRRVASEPPPSAVR